MSVLLTPRDKGLFDFVDLYCYIFRPHGLRTFDEDVARQHVAAFHRGNTAPDPSFASFLQKEPAQRKARRSGSREPKHPSLSLWQTYEAVANNHGMTYQELSDILPAELGTAKDLLLAHLTQLLVAGYVRLDRAGRYHTVSELPPNVVRVRIED